MPANQNPIYTLKPRIGGTANAISVAATGDLGGTNPAVACVFKADDANGSYVQKLRFKALGTNVATVARIFINNGLSPRANVCGPVTGLTGTPQTTGGDLKTGTIIGKVYTIDPWGAASANSAEVTVNTVGPTARIDWFWTANTGANSYVLVVGARTSEPLSGFSNANSSFQQTVYRNTVTGVLSQTNEFREMGFTQLNTPGGFSPLVNNTFYGEVSLPAVTGIATAATIDIDYPMNLALPAGYRVMIGLGTTVASGWTVTTVAGDY